MKKLLVAGLIAACSQVAQAEWFPIFVKPELGTILIENTKIRNANGVYKVWAMFSFENSKNVNGKTYKSNIVQKEFDCVKETHRTNFSAYYADKLGEKELVSIDPVSPDWFPVVPNSGNDILLTHFCSNAK